MHDSRVVFVSNEKLTEHTKMSRLFLSCMPSSEGCVLLLLIKPNRYHYEFINRNTCKIII